MSNYRIVTRAYPTNYWREHGEEIIGTANELHDNEWSFRESRQLLANGLRTRSLEATGGSVKQVWISGLTIAVFLIVLQFATAQVASWFGGVDYTTPGQPAWAEVGALLALFAFTISTRWPVMALVAVVLISGGTDAEPAGLAWLAAGIMIAACGVIARFGNGRRLISPIPLTALFGGLLLTTRLFFVFGPGLLVPAMLIASVLLVRFDARLAAAISIYAIFTAVSMLVFAIDARGQGVPVELVIAGVSAVVAASLAVATNRCTRQLAHP